MNFINKKLLEMDLFYEGTLVLKYHIEYPIICSNSARNFNNYNKCIAFNLRRKSENELYKEAVELYKYNKANGYPIMIYEVYRTFEVTFNSYNIVSLYADEYIFSGGAHGNTVRSSQNWNLLRGCMFPLESLFPNNSYFMINILKEINNQIASNPEIYFDNTCNLVLETFNPKSFYLIPNGIVIYFQTYDIAPYSSGIRTFVINYVTKRCYNI
ncbi:MAG: DUF3298 and DUF4163 domain-containing protein [Clostridia bacterium]|nr:DUF3298 and DUF4163 domain-containing protein [Clostridia bacterium]